MAIILWSASITVMLWTMTAFLSGGKSGWEGKGRCYYMLWFACILKITKDLRVQTVTLFIALQTHTAVDRHHSSFIYCNEKQNAVHEKQVIFYLVRFHSHSFMCCCANANIIA